MSNKTYSLDAKIRKEQSMLICSGIGVILFGVWSVVRLLWMRYLDTGHFMHLIGGEEIMQDEMVRQIVMILLLLVLFVDLAVRLYIGQSAIREGMGRYKKRITYIIIALLYVFFNVKVDIDSSIRFFMKEYDVEFFIYALIDITANIATVTIIISAIRLRKLVNGQLPFLVRQRRS